MPLEQYRKLLPAIRMTAAALRREAEYVARKNTTEAQRLRLRARAIDARAAEIARELSDPSAT